MHTCLQDGEESVGGIHGVQAKICLTVRLLWNRLLHITVLHDRSLEDTNPGKYNDRLLRNQQAQILAETIRIYINAYWNLTGTGLTSPWDFTDESGTTYKSWDQFSNTLTKC